MSRPYFVRVLTRSERNRNAELLRDPPNVKVFLRAKAVDLSSQGWKVHEIAGFVERDRSVVSRWLHRFDDEGVDGLWPKKSPGRPRQADDAFRQATDQAARQNPRALGYDFTRWTTDLLTEHLVRTTGVEVGAGTVHHVLRDLGFRWGRPKLDLAHRQDPQDVARAKRARNRALKKHAGPTAGSRSSTSMKPSSI